MAGSVEWDRQFQLWHYNVRYSRLLIRGIDQSLTPKRVEILFSNVEYLRVRSLYDSISIREIATTDRRLVGIPEDFPMRGKIFSINDGTDYVIATHCQWAEDDGGAHSPSSFGSLQGVE
ncbi:hypothetical protein [Actinomadura rubteroloni]|uniref:hypothetical protein n=1 Tax=Actinomadura rubteroloni TaxID=1926885 RepID=UPI0011B0BF71|nr:hypothetical protein [Actinomadura rubteroloni]